MKKFLIAIVTIVIVLPILLGAACYGAIQYKYNSIFMPGIVINGVYAADQTVSDVAKKLSEAQEMPILEIVENNGKSHTIDMKELSYQADFTNEVQKIKDSQDVLTFVNWLIDENRQTKEYTIEPTYSYDENAMNNYLEKEEYLKDNSDSNGKKVEVRYSSLEGYYLYDETVALLSHEKAVKAIKKGIDNQEFKVNLEDEDCYVKAEYTQDMKDSLDLWKKLEKYMNSSIIYEVGGQKLAVDGKVISGFLAKDENGELAFDDKGDPYIDEKIVKEYVHQFVEDYSTVRKERRFKATRGDIVTVKSTTYGVKIDEKTEYEYLLSAIDNGRSINRTPELSQTNYTNIIGLDDIGRTYVEVDMTNQHMYYYVDGRLKLSTDVVTGCTSLGRGTPEMVCFVYGKQKERILRGPGYESFVHFWIPVNKGIGIHDASWRSKYGGELYKRGGSHGCINTPYDQVSKLYDMVEIGTPVVIFY